MDARETKTAAELPTVRDNASRLVAAEPTSYFDKLARAMHEMRKARRIDSGGALRSSEAGAKSGTSRLFRATHRR